MDTMSAFENYLLLNKGLKLRKCSKVFLPIEIKYNLIQDSKTHDKSINDENVNEYCCLSVHKNYGSTQVIFDIHSCGEYVTLVIKDNDNLTPIGIGSIMVGSFSSTKSFMLNLIVDKKDNIRNHLDSLYEFYVSGKW